MCSSKRKSSIQVARILAMLSIVMCHTIKYYTFIPGSQMLNVVFNVGVFMFLFISGYLYGNKEISDFKTWFAKRVCKVGIPSTVTIIVVLLILMVPKLYYSISTYIIYLFNLQGLMFLNFSAFSQIYSEVQSLGHLWFVTIIMLCYLILPILQKIKNKQKQAKDSMIVIAVVVMYIVFFVFHFFLQVSLICFLTFILGYFFNAYNIEKKFSKSIYVIFSIIVISAQVMRFGLRLYIDGSQLYNSFVAISHSVLGIWLVVSIVLSERVLPNVYYRLSSSKLINHFDKMSYYIYLTHGIFTVGVFNVYQNDRYNILVSTILFIVCTYGSALLIKIIAELVTKPILKKIND